MFIVLFIISMNGWSQLNYSNPVSYIGELEGVANNYTTSIEEINIENGESCVTAFSYLYVNDPAVTGSTIYAYDVEWWSFELVGNFTNIVVSLCGSSFDTRLAVYNDCNSSYIGFNDDYCGSQSQLNFTYLSAGTYYVKVYGYDTSFGSYVLQIESLIASCGHLIDLVGTDVQCNGGSNGSIDLTLTNIWGTLPFYYIWSNGAVTPNLNALAAGTYEVTVTDAYNCAVYDSYVVGQPDLLIIESTDLDPSCEQCTDGSISISMSGGSLPYTYYWSTGETSQDLNNLLYGSYGITVNDYYGCEATEEYFILHNPPDTQRIALDIGWNMFSTYKSIPNPNLDTLLNSIQGNYSILKNWEGEVFMPQYGVNTIDTVEVEYGFQIKMNSNDTLLVSGPTFVPDSLIISLPSGWCMIGYPRYIDGDIVNMMNSIVNHILIMKDEDGGVYWPNYGVNLINVMHPGDAYQVKTDTVLNFVYPEYGSNL